MTPFVLLLIPLGITIKNHKDSKILKVVEQNIKRIKLIWLFVIEWILATASVLSGLRYLSSLQQMRLGSPRRSYRYGISHRHA